MQQENGALYIKKINIITDMTFIWCKEEKNDIGKIPDLTVDSAQMKWEKEIKNFNIEK